MRARLAIWVFLSLIGAAVVALPDANDRLFSFSEAHGPSPLDALGIACLLAGWAAVAPRLWSERARLRSTRLFETGLFALGVGVGLVVASALEDFGWWWAVGAVVAVAVQAVAVAALLRAD